ncbi:prepilin-type N-terminal cleavage/methylation domain-containing protein [Alcanivorax sp. 1008]|uniref:prepilin-type N-terminal cleavage/methylation domain-containing protein n=1 Tax=Alcanivorax sp. 1008 TaxID=2816853 RepID=UPI001D6C33AD|nr:prepilin-type N-terminal cleavage/methylation domain-containing protein [Alcanivorax sp. 1008]MCC1498107.1 prepilin-type N-terminal cleavage/methylation domain-containing protein [Alcanivorax sp. 1008]
MQISASVIPGRNNIRSACPRQSGFTLLEVLVVVALMVLVATLLVSAALRGSTGDPAGTAAQRFSDTVALMSENSLFRGELLALRLSDTGWTPLGFDVANSEFIPLASPLTETELEQGVLLEWKMEESRNPDRPDIADVGASLISDELMVEKKQEVPQIFFFPSGEVTPLTVWLVQVEGNVSHELMVDPLGRVTVVGDEP